jgi:hypothetical protein
VAKHIQRTSEDPLQIETGSSLPGAPSSHQGRIAASRELSDKESGAHYRLTAPGAGSWSEQSKWQAFARDGAGLNSRDEP